MIKLVNVSAGYGGKDALCGVSFELEKGESLSIIGPNGSGKTTLLRAIAGTMQYSGDIYIDGVKLRKMKRKALAMKISLLPQLARVYFNYTVYDTVMMGRYVHEEGGLFGGITEKDRNVVNMALKFVGLHNMIERGIGTLSGGELQRVFLAKTIAQNPEIILLDEPTNHLDLSFQVEFIRFMNEWARSEGKTVIGVLHDINLAALLSDNILLMENGSAKAFGKCADVFSSSVLSDVYKMDVASHMLDTLEMWREIQRKKDI